MHINSYITKRNAKIYKELKDEFKFDYVETFIIGGTLGILMDKNNLHTTVEEELGEQIEIPHHVLYKKKPFISNLYAIMNLNENINLENKKELLYLAYKDIYDEDKKFTELGETKRYEEYVSQGVRYLYERTILASRREMVTPIECFMKLIVEMKTYIK